MFLLVSLLACTEDSENKRIGTTVDVDWGSWEISTDLQHQDEVCESLGANGSNIGILFGEIEVDDSVGLILSLGDKVLTGDRDEEGFFITAFNELEVNHAEPDEFGIGVMIGATVLDEHSFTGSLVYQLDFPNGFCNIEMNIDAFWLYYEPPPDCGG
jgi:hypothetical protein